MGKPSVFVTRRWPNAVESRLSETYDTTFNRQDRALTPTELKEALIKYDAILPTVTDSLNAEVLDVASPKTRFLGNFGVGYSHICEESARALELTVTNTPDLTNPYAPVIDNRNNNSNGHSEENDFTVPEKKASIKVTAQTKKAKVTWKKVSHATGYQVQCSTSKKFNKNKKTSSTNKLKKTIKGLKKGKTYYIRVRAYSMDSGMRYYAPWSSVKKVKIKK